MLTLRGQNGSEILMNTSKHQPSFRRHFAILVMLIIGMTASCNSATIPPTPTNTPTIVETSTPTRLPPIATPRPTTTPTQSPLGSEANPIKIGFILAPDETTANEAAEDVAFLIGKDTGFAIESLIYPDFQDLATAIINGEVDLFWLKPLEYLYLNWESAAEVVLMTNHLGVYAYGVQFMANVSRGFTSFFDPETNQSLGDPISALQQFSGTRPCFTDSNSIPGYYVPLGLLTLTSTPTLDPVITYSYNATIRALYIQGICDFGVSYALTGDPRTASDILDNIPDAQNQVEIIWQSDGIIPNINLSASPELPLHIQHRLQEAFLNLPDTPEGLDLLSAALNYQVEALKTVEDSFYNPLRDALIPLELDLETITRQQINP